MSDLPEILALVQADGNGPHWPADAWAAYMNEAPGEAPKRVLLLARDNEQAACGWIAGTLLGNTAELEFVLVCHSDRGAGLGSALLLRWSAWATNRGAKELFLEVRASNKAALRLYRQSGFIPVGVRREYYRDPLDDALVMQRIV